MSATSKRKPLVRYCSPFGSPAWMPRAEAERYLAADESLYRLHREAGLLDGVRPPYIEQVN